MQKNKFMPWAMVSAVVLASCGGGGDGVVDFAKPVISTVGVKSDGKGQITFTAIATDNIAVTGYCFQNSSTPPLPSAACFQSASSSTLSSPQTAATYVWAKDAANNLSEAALAGCSATGVTASQGSTLPTVCVSTSLGEFILALESTKAPLTTANFLKYVNDGFYSQTLFHRILTSPFSTLTLVQGGGYKAAPFTIANLKISTYPAIALEAPAATGLSNTVGTIAMARSNDLNSAQNQFFINALDNKDLDLGSGGYAVFGQVISGLNTTIQNIRNVPLTSNGIATSQPVTPPVIVWAYQLK